MFTGLIAAKGQVLAMEDTASGRRARVRLPAGDRLREIREGDSVAINGVCLTARAVREKSFDVDVSLETLARTTLGEMEVGRNVNLEPALRVGEPLGGHFVSGHVDAVGDVASIQPKGESRRVEVSAPREIGRYLVPRGSICVDGVSLTVTEVSADAFDVMLIPHTRAASLAGEYRVGQRVNLEVDMLARYLERLLEERGQT